MKVPLFPPAQETAFLCFCIFLLSCPCFSGSIKMCFFFFFKYRPPMHPVPLFLIPFKAKVLQYNHWFNPLSPIPSSTLLVWLPTSHGPAVALNKVTEDPPTHCSGLRITFGSSSVGSSSDTDHSLLPHIPFALHPLLVNFCPLQVLLRTF